MNELPFTVEANNRVQATPDCACLFFLRQRSGAPDPTLSVAEEATDVRSRDPL
jgi:hypothetical protein